VVEQLRLNFNDTASGNGSRL